MLTITVTRQDIIRTYACSNMERLAMDAEDGIDDVITHADDVTLYVRDIKCLNSNHTALACIARLLKGGWTLGTLPAHVFERVEELHANATKFALIITDAVTETVLGAIDGSQVSY